MNEYKNRKNFNKKLRTHHTHIKPLHNAKNCVHTVLLSADADSCVLNTPKTICFSHLVALRSATRTRLHTDMVDYGRPEVLLSTLLVLNLRRLTATSGYQVRARCQPSGFLIGFVVLHADCNYHGERGGLHHLHHVAMGLHMYISTRH